MNLNENIKATNTATRHIVGVAQLTRTVLPARREGGHGPIKPVGAERPVPAEAAAAESPAAPEELLEAATESDIKGLI